VIVASTAANAAAGNGDVWDSGKVDSGQQTGVAYGGEPLAPNHRYHWTVQTWDENGEASALAAPTWFGTSPGGDWTGSTPIWADTTLPGHEQQVWDDYTITTSFTITQTALGLLFRAPDGDNAFMYQFRADNNRIVPHTLVDGAYAALPHIDLPGGTLVQNQRTFLELTVSGHTVTTKLGPSADALVEVASQELTPQQLPATGTVGFRSGRTEAGYVHELEVRAADDTELFNNDFSNDHGFPCGSVSNGAYNVGNSQACVYGAGVVSADWAFLRTEITPADKEIVGATFSATAGDFRAHKQYTYKAYVNGEFVGLGPTNRIHSENRFDGFDVTGLLRAGEPNAIGVVAYTTGSGNQRFIGQLRVDYADGTAETFGSGESWKALPGSLAYPAAGSIGTGFYNAPKENLDLREFPSGFDQPGFDDSGWAGAVTKPAFADLRATPMAKVQEQLHEPVSIVDKGDGTYFVDFGRTWIGGVKYSVANGAAGDRIDLRFGEVETAPGSQTVRYQLNTGNTYQDIITLRDGEQTAETWGMRVFRYLEIVGAPEPVTADKLQALALVYPFDQDASFFSSSNENLNQVYQLSKNSIESLNVNFFTDSWSRERINYEADGYLQQMSSLYLMEDLSLARYSMNYFEGNRTWPTEWPIYVVLAVHDAWRQTGDLEQVEQYYDNLATKAPTRWIDPGTGLVGKANGSNGCNSSTDCDIVDWPTSQRDGYQFRHYNTVLNALSYRALRDMAAMAQALGKDDDATSYTAQADRLRSSMNELLYNEELGAYDDGMTAAGQTTGHHALHASAFALAFGVPEDGQVSHVADFVANKGMACSVYCAGFSITGLIDGGRADAAIAQLTGDGTSSWMNMIRRGAGATAEAWDESQKSNLTYSHPWAASPAFHVPSGLFGIRPIEAGYATFQVKPQPGSLEHAAVAVPTVKGRIGVAFDHDDEDRIQLVASVPGNTSADISVPVPAGTETVYLDGVAREVSEEGGFATLESVPAGCRLVTLDDGASAVSSPVLTAVCAPTLDDSEPGGGDDDDNGTDPDPKPEVCTTPRSKPVFADTPRSHQFYREIDWLHCVGYTTGITQGNRIVYAPKDRLSREAMAAFIYRMEAPKGFTAPRVSPFADVKPTDKFYRQITWMHAEGLTTGVKNPAGGKPLFQPKRALTREAMAAFMYRLESPKGYRAPAVSPVADVRRGDKFYTEVSWMVSEGLSTGIKAGNGKREYRPKSTLTREATAAFIYRLENSYRK
jgi:alpha-L-rhamnosidase